MSTSPIRRLPSIALALLLLAGAACQPARTPRVTFLVPSPAPSTATLPGFRGTARGAVDMAMARVKGGLSLVSGVNIGSDGRNSLAATSGWVLHLVDTAAEQVNTVQVTSEETSVATAPLSQVEPPLPVWSVDSATAVQLIDPLRHYPSYVLLLGGYTGAIFNAPGAPLLWQIGDGTKSNGFTDFVDARLGVRTDFGGKPVTSGSA